MSSSSAPQQQATIRRQANDGTTAPASAPATGGGEKAKSNLPMPSEKTLQQAFKLGLIMEKQICGYFYVDSIKGKVSIETHEGEKIIYKNENEHTSRILNTYKTDSSYIVVTENTIYILGIETVIKP
jgi:hypothetical protein